MTIRHEGDPPLWKIIAWLAIEGVIFAAFIAGTCLLMGWTK